MYELLDCFNTCFPKSTGSKKSSTSCWINDQVRTSSQNLRDLYILQRRYPILVDIYKRKKKLHNQLMTITKRQYYSNKITFSQDKNKTTWNIINDLQNKKRNDTSGLSITDFPDSPEDVANSFNTFFQQTPVNLMRDVPAVRISDSHLRPSEHTMYLFPYSELEVRELFQRLRGSSAPGPDEIPSFLLKLAIDELVAPLTYLINESFINGQFPSKLKSSVIVPIHKKGSKSELSNYRPINICYFKVI